ncbi:hypothetical protein Sjap_005371 [Stephania japonica]|uniref:Uncharacterized protein n=1 Tax=Stephania japonica TaxID=461633 RepID=A0AAP0K3W8_9MAGN
MTDATMQVVRLKGAMTNLPRRTRSSGAQIPGSSLGRSWSGFTVKGWRCSSIERTRSER